MKIIKLLLNDIKSGENIDLYATVILSFGLVVLGLIGVSTTSWIPSLTLTVLGLLAISNLVNRHRMDELLKKSSESTETVFLDEFTSEQQNFGLSNATELWLVGIALTQTIRKQYSTIESLLKKGSTVKVLLVHPEGSALEIAATRSYRQASSENTKNEILATIADLCQLKKIAPNNLEIRTIQNPLGHAVFALDPKSASGTLYIAHYPFRMPGASKPKFILKAKDGKWYDYYKDELYTLWENGIEWQCQ